MTQMTSLLDIQREVWKQRYKIQEIPDETTLDKVLDKTKAKFFYSGSKMKGWLGSLICNHKYVWDEWCSTAWCNGETIGINPWFFMACTWDGRVSLVVHEVWHTGADHFGRVGNRDLNDWNIAGDHWINTNMIQDGFSFDPKDMAGIQGHANMAYKDMHTEQIYDIIHEEKQKKKSGSFGSPSESPSDGSEGSGNPNPDDPSSGDKYAAAAGSQDNQAACSGDMREPPKTKDGRDPTEARMRKILGAIQASHMSKDAGTIPGEIQRHIDKWLNPVLPWETLLERWFTALSNDDFSYRKPNRRYEDEYLPSLIGNDGLEHLIFYVDASASVTDDELKCITSEAHSIHRDISPAAMTVVAFDTEIQGEWTFEADDNFDELPIVAGGGTCLKCVYNHIIEHAPTAVVILSDMHVDPMEQDPLVPILWVSVANSSPEIPFGDLVHIKKEDIIRVNS